MSLTQASAILCRCLNRFDNHKMVWVRRDVKDHLVPTPLGGDELNGLNPYLALL